MPEARATGAARAAGAARRRTAAVVVGALALAAAAAVLPAPSGAVAGAAAATGASSCTVSGATLSWGVKESFRSYISGSIAKGAWTPEGGATYATPSFGWASGAGQLGDGPAGDVTTGDVAFVGSVRFTGHQGVLDTTIADPVLRFTSPTSAQLLLDVAGTTQEGVAVSSPDVPFADVDLTASPVDPATGALSFAGAPTTLTAEGAAAFGSYEPGTALDPLTADVPVACTAPVDAEEAAVTSADEADATQTATSAPAAAASASGDASTDAGPTPAALAWSAVAAAALLGALAWLLVRRRRLAASSSAASDDGTGGSSPASSTTAHDEKETP
ncbi:HtaA domain-containing protein [Frigoribacterium sp. PhB116]|uniref:HtaA domain-containing protein n=1 Tax=Frigoribacterium sp. PhB116 TaxID=2485174 RepID=UPI0010DB9B12|nr:HtaA domain-containing protein [Frigoribacterium sp. PhB116]TDT62672.1 Htaa protein [Frigoribacterium sp. PhB116]